MPDDTKKNQDKRKNDPKEQRKPRNSRNQGSKQEKKIEKIEESKSVPKVPQKAPVYDDPGPEFYKGLKRETEEILKITEEETSKYRKKEIQSNWSKYEMPIESYDEIEEHDIGADYEKLIQAPLSIGGHFQFKHEKSWDVNTGPSLYDKYFDIDMDNLSLAISTIPFYERNNIDKTIFSVTDIVNMTKRSAKYMEKYLNDKSQSSVASKSENKEIMNSENTSVENESKQESRSNTNHDERIMEIDDINLDLSKINTDLLISAHNQNQNMNPVVAIKINVENYINSLIDNNIFDEIQNDVRELRSLNIHNSNSQTLPSNILVERENIITEKDSKHSVTNTSNTTEIELLSDNNVTEDIPAVTKNPVIESPEDLEKWLDDFLDG